MKKIEDYRTNRFKSIIYTMISEMNIVDDVRKIKLKMNMDKEGLVYEYMIFSKEERYDGDPIVYFYVDMKRYVIYYDEYMTFIRRLKIERLLDEGIEMVKVRRRNDKDVKMKLEAVILKKDNEIVSISIEKKDNFCYRITINRLNR